MVVADAAMYADKAANKRSASVLKRSEQVIPFPARRLSQAG